MADHTLLWTLLELAWFAVLRLERKRLRRRAERVALEEATGAMVRLREVALEDLQVAAVPIALEQPLPLPASGVSLYFDGASTYAAIWTPSRPRSTTSTSNITSGSRTGSGCSCARR